MYLNDLWRLNLSDYTWTKIESQEEKPQGRSGHSMLECNNEIYIFGGKTSNFHETNEIWKFNPNSNSNDNTKFILVQDTILEQYTDRELSEGNSNPDLDKAKQKKFKLLTFDQSMLTPEMLSRSMKLPKKHNNKSKFNSNSFDIKAICERELIKTPYCGKIKKSIIYNLDSETTLIKNKLSNLAVTQFLTKTDQIVESKPPTPRDGQSMIIYNNSFLIFGGDRNKFPYNDLYKFKF